MIRIQKVCLTDGKVTIHYQKRSMGGSWDRNTTVCSELPSRGFEDALQRLGQGVVELLELPSADLPSIDVEGVAVKYPKRGNTWMASIVGTRMLAKSAYPMHFATPLKQVNRADLQAGDRSIFSHQLTRQLVEVFGFAERYLGGLERSQMSLFDDRPPQPPAPPSAPDDEAPDIQPADDDTSEPADTSAVPDLDDTYDYLFGDDEEEGKGDGDGDGD
ncbi:MAG: hypothetical protein ACYC6A_00680 [Armatimonadota bacterium]